jgi:transposase
MYVNISRHKTYTRVRLMRKIIVDDKPKTVLVEHIGSARSLPELAVLRTRAQARIEELRPQLNLLAPIDAGLAQQSSDASRLTISGSFASGLWQVLGGVYDALGLPGDSLLKYLVLARIATPKSKLATTRFLKDNLSCSVSTSQVYKYMDSLDRDSLMTTLLAYAQSRALRRSGQTIAVVFYDVTTLYFETDQDDPDSEGSIDTTTGEIKGMITGLRKYGYSKDHRHDLPQVVVGLTVDEYGFPLDFQVYDGSTYEGSTLLDGITSIRTKLNLTSVNLTVVADAGMLSKANLETLEASGYSYIVGARIRSGGVASTKQITDWDYARLGNFDQSVDGRRLVVTYSSKRAERSKSNRQRLVTKLRTKLAHGQVVKKSKYIRLDDAKKPTGQIDQAKLDYDTLFDGLKGYVTNTTLSVSELITQYGNLWRVEKSFRMSKSDLRARPTFHYKRERILAHLLICVCALGVLREFEQRVLVRLPDVGLSVALEQLLAIRDYKLRLTDAQQIIVKSELTEVQQGLMQL